MDGRKLAPGPNQLAGILGKAADKTKGQVLDLQNRPAAFHEGSQATRRLAGRDVTISSPILGMRIPTGKEYTQPKSGGGAAKSGTPPSRKEADKGSSGTGAQDLSSLEGPPSSQALARRQSGGEGEGGSHSGQHDQPGPQAMVKYEGKGEPRIVEIPDFPSTFGRTADLPRRGSFDLGSAAGGHNPQAMVRRDSEPSPSRITEIPDMPSPPATQALVKRESKETGSQFSSLDLSANAGGHDPLKPTPKRTDADSPARMTGIPEHVPTPLSTMVTIPEHVPTPPSPRPSERPPAGSDERPALPTRPSLHRQDTRPHIDPGMENLHLSQPGNHFDEPPPYAVKPPAGHKTTETGPGVPGQPGGEIAEEGEKKMGLGKKVMMGVGGIAALLGITFLMSTPTPPPPPPHSS